MSESNPSNWMRKVTAVLVMAAVAPLAVAIAARTAVDVLGPVMPYAIGLLILLGIYHLVFRGWWWR